MTKRRQLNDPRVDDWTTSFFHKKDDVWCQPNNDLHGLDNYRGVQTRLDGMPNISLDKWDGIYGTHFDYETAMPAWGSWAGAPFVTPGYIGFTEESMVDLRLTNAVAERAFFYRAVGSTPTMALLGSMYGLGSDFTSGLSFGYRIDDGTDNNYVEGGIITNDTSVAGATESGRSWFRTFRTGGGGVTQWLGTKQPFPPHVWFNSSIQGTLYTNWGVTTLGSGMSHNSNTRLWVPNNYPTGLAWTPTRVGLVIQKYSTATWYRWHIDAMRLIT